MTRVRSYHRQALSPSPSSRRTWPSGSREEDGKDGFCLRSVKDVFFVFLVFEVSEANTRKDGIHLLRLKKGATIEEPRRVRGNMVKCI